MSIVLKPQTAEVAGESNAGPHRAGVRSPALGFAIVVAAIWILGVSGTALAAAEAKKIQPKTGELTASQLFDLTKVWTVHFTFTPEQWRAMEPKGDMPDFFGGGRGGRGGFGPGMMLAPVMVKQGDKDSDSSLSAAEFRDLGIKWFDEWDKERQGSLSAEQLRAGLNATIGTPNFSPRGGRGGGFNLQGGEGKRNGLASSMGVEFEQVHAAIEIGDTRFADVAVRYKGNGTWMQSRGSPKRSLKVDLNQFVKGQKLAGVSTLNFHNCVTDASWMNEVLSHRLYRDAGLPASRTAYAQVYVTVPGVHDRTYLGVYSMVENVDNAFLEANFGSRKGALFKPVTPNPFTDLGDDWAKYNQTYDPKGSLSEAQQRRVIDLCKLVSHADDATFAARVGEFVDLEQFAGYMAVTVWLSTLDSILTIGQNYYVHLDPTTARFQFIPWDLDHSFGQFFIGGSQEARENLSIQRPWRGEIRFLDRVFKVETFKQRYLEKLKQFDATIFKPDRFAQQVDAIAAAIRPAVEKESAEKLERFDKVAAGEPVPPVMFGGGPGRPGGGPGGPGGPGGFFQPAKPIKGFVVARARSVSDQLAGKSDGELLADMGFGGGRGGRVGRGGGGGFGPGNFVGDSMLTALDADKDGQVSKAEFCAGFDKWFSAWAADGKSALTEDQLTTGINRDLAPRFGPGGPGGPGGGGPGGPPRAPPEPR
jgi:hypothetical protein